MTAQYCNSVGRHSTGRLSPYADHYDAFDAYRAKPATPANPDITDRGFTGHRMNNTGSHDMGLIYKQAELASARTYVPEDGRLASRMVNVPHLNQDPASTARF